MPLTVQHTRWQYSELIFMLTCWQLIAGTGTETDWLSCSPVGYLTLVTERESAETGNTDLFSILTAISAKPFFFTFESEAAAEIFSFDTEYFSSTNIAIGISTAIIRTISDKLSE